jgi:prefoldin subunit 5
VVSKLQVGSLYISNNAAYVGSGKSITFESDGGILHGSWTTEAALVTSDRRLKKEIIPLQRTLREVITGKEPPVSPGTTSAAATPSAVNAPGGNDGALWLLRQLRPVSYSFKKGAESKYMRFGFIADELESVVPQVVRSVGNQQVADQKAVVYQDLIALLAAAQQSLSAVAETQQSRIGTMEATLKELKDKLSSIEEAKEESGVNETTLVTTPIPEPEPEIDIREIIEEMKAEINAVTSERKALEEQMAELQASKEAEQEESRGLLANLMQRRRTASRRP